MGFLIPGIVPCFVFDDHLFDIFLLRDFMYGFLFFSFFVVCGKGQEGGEGSGIYSGETL